MLPFLLQPHLVDKPWAGSTLAARAGARGRGVGEAWEASSLAEGSSTIVSGPLAGSSASVLSIPLLVKLIDAAEDLSVQVHPGFGSSVHLGSKEETWLVLRAARHAHLLHGFHDHVTPASWERALDSGDDAQVRACLRQVPVREGDVVHVPPGVVHAIGAGILLLEVQEPRDVTFRLWDYNRIGSDGKLRPLHRAQGAQCVRFDAQPSPLVQAHGDTIIDGHNYRVMRLRDGPIPAGRGVLFTDRHNVMVSSSQPRERMILPRGSRVVDGGPRCLIGWCCCRARRSRTFLRPAMPTSMAWSPPARRQSRSCSWRRTKTGFFRGLIAASRCCGSARILALCCVCQRHARPLRC
jgi:mannose-6-phosphate isomerase